MAVFLGYNHENGECSKRSSSIFQGNRLLIKLGDKEVEFNPDFKFYITTKLSNPHYTPEITTKTAIVNFAVKEQGLEAQLLGIVVRKERPELEEQKDKLVVNIAQSKKKLASLEDEILRWGRRRQGVWLSLRGGKGCGHSLEKGCDSIKSVVILLLGVEGVWLYIRGVVGYGFEKGCAAWG